MAQERTDDVVDILAGLALFADLSRPQLQAVAHTLEEEWFTEGQRVLRQGFGGANFYVILDGEAAVKINGETRATLGRGDFFGEVSALLGETPTADVVAMRPLRCAVLSGAEMEQFLRAYPSVMYRMLQAQARRLRNANRWRS
ncbi:MAG: cyclic nucleotide-binding domain-containing protein [Armatimonadota bacterium]|nr:cyclic nucleotide-binding domain-containing protein [Armatimonadota bacterium]